MAWYTEYESGLSPGARGADGCRGQVGGEEKGEAALLSED